MGDRRGALLYVAMVITDATWLWLAVGIIGLSTGQGGSPLPWPSVLTVLMGGALFTRVLQRAHGKQSNLNAIHGGFGLLIIYLVIAASPVGGREGLHLAWGMEFLSGQLAATTILGIVIALFAGAYLWRHGASMTAHPSPLRRMVVSFKVGIVVIALALLLEQASGADLGAQRSMILFFAASLAGLAAGRIPPDTGIGVEWVRVVASTVVVIVALGVALGLTAGVFGRDGLVLAGSAWGYLSDAVVWVIRTLLGAVVDAIGVLVEWLRGDQPLPGQGVNPGAGAPPWWRQLELDSSSPVLHTIAEIVQSLFLLVLIYPLYRLFITAYKRSHYHYAVYRSEQHESIKGDAEALSDFLRLLRRLIPGSGTGREEGRLFRAPDAEPGIMEVFGLYYDLISCAVLRGHAFVPAVTPLERVADLEKLLPEAPVAEITGRFNAACYGQERTDANTIAALRERLERVL